MMFEKELKELIPYDNKSKVLIERICLLHDSLMESYKQRVKDAVEKAYSEASSFEGGQIINEVDDVFNTLKKKLGIRQ